MGFLDAVAVVQSGFIFRYSSGSGEKRYKVCVQDVVYSDLKGLRGPLAVDEGCG